MTREGFRLPSTWEDGMLGLSHSSEARPRGLLPEEVLGLFFSTLSTTKSSLANLRWSLESHHVSAVSFI